MFKEPALQHAHSRVHHMQEMEMYVKKKQEAEAAESHYVVGTSEEVQLTAGSVVRITSPFGERMGGLAKASLGEYLIIDIEHSVGEGNYYANRFRAVPSGVRSLPLPDVELAVAETQMARVTSNADPEGKGRVQVQMNWQTGNMHTDWIRGLTPDGGSSDNVGANRGFVFIPEVGDHVLVGFRHNDPNRPYIMGSLFNGKTGKGGGEGNNTKSITTKSGSTIKLDDSSGSIFIADKTGKNLITIDGTDAITMLSAKTVTLSNGKSSITIEDEKVTISAKEVNITGESSIVCTSGESDSLAIAKGKGVGVNGKNISIEAENIVGASGGTSVTMSSPSTSISGDANVTIDGGLVKINS